jgi:hypothetical protein
MAPEQEYRDGNSHRGARLSLSPVHHRPRSLLITLPTEQLLFFFGRNPLIVRCKSLLFYNLSLFVVTR